VDDELLALVGELDEIDHRRGQALVTARFDAHAAIDTGDTTEVAVATERLHFFDLKTGKAIRS
jgi:hypothetical protein